jgi:ribose 5-phosphate isomerase A
LITDGMLVGLGTGTTVAFLIPLLAARVAQGLSIQAVATSQETADTASHLGITVIPFDGSRTVDITLDGADEVDPELRLIKGGGGALLHEKLVAVSSCRNVVIADSTKLVTKLGKRPLPVEVVKFGWQRTLKEVKKIGCRPELRQSSDGKPFLTQEGNYIIDCSFDSITDPSSLAQEIKAVVGVIEHGLFLKTASEAIIGRGTGTELLRASH